MDIYIYILYIIIYIICMCVCIFICHALSGQGPGCSMAPGPHQLGLQALACPRHPHFPTPDVRLEHVRLEAVHRAICRVQHLPAFLPCPGKGEKVSHVSRFSVQDLLQRKNCSMPMPLANCVLELSGYINFFHYNRTGCHCIANVCPVPNSFVKCL